MVQTQDRQEGPSSTVQTSSTEAQAQSSFQNQSARMEERELQYNSVSKLSGPPKMHKSELGRVLCQLVLSIVRNNSGLSSEFEIFNTRDRSCLEIQSFVCSTTCSMKCSDSCFILSIILLDRIQTLNPELVLTQGNMYRLVTMALVISAKYCDDYAYHNRHYAGIVDMELAEFNRLQSKFLKMINFELYVEDDLFERYRARIEAYGQRKRKATKTV